jgi:hypothetical protein
MVQVHDTHKIGLEEPNMGFIMDFALVLSARILQESTAIRRCLLQIQRLFPSHSLL